MQPFRSLIILALAAVVLCAGGGTAHAASPFERLGAAREGDRVQLARGVVLVVHGHERSGETVRVRRGVVRLGGVATGRRVRVTARAGRVTLTGGRFTVAGSLSDRDYTIASAAPLVIATGPDGAPVMSGRLAALALREPAARVRAAASEPEVEQALPAPPGAARWRLGLGLNLEGLTVRVLLGDQQVGSGLVRYDGSYRFALSVRDVPALGARISASGDVAGRDITKPSPITNLRGDVQGMMRLTDDVSVGDGTLSWDADGMRLDVAARLSCPDGGITTRATGTYRTDEQWSIGVRGGTAPDGCEVAAGADLGDVSVDGDLASTDGVVTGQISATTSADATLPLGSDASLAAPSLAWQIGGIKLGAGLRLPCPAGGSVTASVSVVLPHGRGFGDWRAAVGATAGANGCGVVDGLAFGAGSSLTAAVWSRGGRLGVDLNADATLQTRLVPTKNAFRVKLALSASGGAFSASVSGSTPGASFRGSIASDTTFEIAFDITDLEIYKTKIDASGRIARTRRGGPVETKLDAAVETRIELAPNLWILGASLGFDGRRLTIGGLVRLGCSKGYVDLAASGDIVDARNFTLDVQALASNCTIGRFAVLDGSALKGTIVNADNRIGIDLEAGVASLTLPKLDDNIGGLAVTFKNTRVNITNRCLDGCTANKLRLTINARLGLTWTHRVGPGGSSLIEGDLRLRLDLFGPTSTFVSLAVTNILADGVPTSLSIELEGYIRRAIGSGFVFVPRRPGDPADEATQIAAGDVGAATTLARVRSVSVRLRARRPAVRVQLSERDAVTVEIERRTCRQGCAWRLVMQRVVQADRRGTADLTTSTRLGAGDYRVVARAGASGLGRPVTRRFRVR
ncbi:hypothetical protein LRS13_03285 [Svornostia abyssi]|uniref:Uncharacterized protein n=1 Tax=Svornostia abyssi TaxID=2898438 RepID=A0ABY5PIQ9_9ACTN|nr:hypothetical protein LRS13_03285 [Parviterribacteraceae bacterium J379]